MVDFDEKPVMEPFPDKVIIRYHEGHERRIEAMMVPRRAVTAVL